MKNSHGPHWCQQFWKFSGNLTHFGRRSNFFGGAKRRYDFLEGTLIMQNFMGNSESKRSRKVNPETVFIFIYLGWSSKSMCLGG